MRAAVARMGDVARYARASASVILLMMSHLMVLESHKRTDPKDAPKA